MKIKNNRFEDCLYYMVDKPIHKLNLDKLIFNICTLKLRMLTKIGSFVISKSLFTSFNSLKRENCVRTNKHLSIVKNHVCFIPLHSFTISILKTNLILIVEILTFLLVSLACFDLTCLNNILFLKLFLHIGQEICEAC